MADTNQNAYLFSPQTRHWIQRGFLFFVGGTVILFPLFLVWGYFGLFVAVIGLWFVYRRDIKPLLQTELEITPYKISGEINGQPVYLFWHDILVAHQTESIKQGYIQLATVHQTITIPLDILDGQALWLVVKEYAPAVALEKEAIDSLFEARRTLEDKQWQAHILPRPLQVGYHWGIKVVAWGCLIFSIWVAMMLYRETGDISTLILPLTFFMLSVFGIYYFSKQIFVNNKGIKVKDWFGQKEMDWVDIQRIESQNRGFLFSSDDKTLWITSPENWTGNDKLAMLEFVNAQIEHHLIEI
ncbi:MAG: hypothetical protein AAF485_12445 [Chloroflexota bacterium]